MNTIRITGCCEVDLPSPQSMSISCPEPPLQRTPYRAYFLVRTLRYFEHLPDRSQTFELPSTRTGHRQVEKTYALLKGLCLKSGPAVLLPAKGHGTHPKTRSAGDPARMQGTGEGEEPTSNFLRLALHPSILYAKTRRG